MRTSDQGGHDSLVPFISVTISALFCMLVMAFAERRYLTEQLRAPSPSANPYWRPGLLLAAATAAVGVNNRVDLIMLRWLDSEEIVGLYAACYVFINAVFLVPMLFSFVLFPDLSRISAHDRETLKHVVVNGARMLALAGSAAGTVMSGLATPLLTMAYPEPYLRATPALRVLCLALPFVFVSNLYWNVLVSRNRQGRILLYISICALLNAGLNLLLVPRFSLVGAGWATVASELIVLLLAGATLTRCDLPRLPGKLVAAMIVVTGVPAIAVHWLSDSLAPVWVVCITVALWTTLALASRILRTQDMRAALRMAARAIRRRV